MTHRLAPLPLLRATAAALLATLLAVACGVGSGGTGSFAAGPITGFGSIIVNDVRFDDTSATVEDGDGVRSSRDDLRLGMTVEVDAGPQAADGSGTRATATRIRVDSEVRGPVVAVDAAAGSFSLLGQVVTVDASTVFAESLGALVPGAVVEVFAVYDTSSARYRAKRVGPASAGAAAQMRGPVGALDTAARTLRIGSGATVYSYASATAVPADLAVGAYLRLRLAPTAGAPGRWNVLSFGTALAALPDADGASYKGLITAFTSAASFSVNGRAVDAGGASFTNGRSGLGNGVRVEVKGNLRNGTLRATEVAIRSDAEDSGKDFEISGSIEAVNAAARTITVRGVTVSLARSDLRLDNGTLANAVVGRRVEVRGRLSGDGLRIEATRLSFD